MKKRFVRTGPQGRFFLRHAFWMYAWESGLLNGHISPGAYRVRVHYSRDNKSFSIFTASLTLDMGLIFGMGMVIWSAYPLVTFIRLDGKVCPCGRLNTQGASPVDALWRLLWPGFQIRVGLSQHVTNLVWFAYTRILWPLDISDNYIYIHALIYSICTCSRIFPTFLV